jgi:hypothetical protein
LSILKMENPGPEGASMVLLLLRQFAGVMEHDKISNPILKDQNRFGILKLGPARRVGGPSEARTIFVIVICLIFEICDLKFLFLQYSKTPRNLYWQSH